MRFMGTQTANRYDQFKNEIFGKKKDEFKEKYRDQHKKPQSKLSYSGSPTNHPFFKKLMVSSVIALCFYYANEKFNITGQVFQYLDTVQVNPIHKATIKSLNSNILRILTSQPQKHTLKQQKNSFFANRYFFNQLNFHLKNLKQKNTSRTLSHQIFSEVNFGPFKFGSQNDKIIVSKQGNVVRKTQRSKISIGNVGLFGSKSQQIIEYQSTVKLFQKNQPVSIQDCCKVINILNKITLSSEQYDKVYNQCVNESKRIYEQIQARVKNTIKKNYSNNKRSKFLISIP